MSSNRLAFAALGIACISAAAGGGYLAMRQNTVPMPAAAQGQEAGAPVTAAGTSRPVQETEGIVADSKTATPAAATKSAATIAKKTDASTRSASVRDTHAPVARQQQAPPPLTSTWPSSAASQQPPPAPLPAPVEQFAPPPPPVPQEPVRAPEPPQKTFEELVVTSGSVIGLQTETRLTSETARVEDRVEARVTRDVKLGDRVAIPAGARAIGSVTQVERGGKFKEVAKLSVRFSTLVLADGTRVPINTDAILRSGDAKGDSTAAKVGAGAVVGTIIGTIFGGAKGAAIGGAAGAGAGSAAVAAGDRSVAVLPAGTPITVRLLAPITITVEK